MDDLTILDYNITRAMEDLDSVAVGAGAIRRLERINRTVAELRVGLLYNMVEWYVWFCIILCNLSIQRVVIKAKIRYATIWCVCGCS